VDEAEAKAASTKAEREAMETPITINWTSLMLTCRTLYDELAHILYSKQHFGIAIEVPGKMFKERDRIMQDALLQSTASRFRRVQLFVLMIHLPLPGFEADSDYSGDDSEDDIELAKNLSMYNLEDLDQEAQVKRLTADCKAKVQNTIDYLVQGRREDILEFCVALGFGLKEIPGLKETLRPLIMNILEPLSTLKGRVLSISHASDDTSGLDYVDQLLEDLVIL